MQERDDIAQAVRYLKLTLPEMSRRNIPTTPENYAVWYEYVTGQNQEIVQAIDLIADQGHSFTPRANHNLYSKFIAKKEQAAVNSIRDGVRLVIASLLEQMGKESRGLNDYQTSLKRFSDDMSQAKELVDIKNMIKSMLEETKQRETATANLQQGMASMAREMQQLKNEVQRLSSEATTDALTRINNRRSFDIELDQALMQARAESQTLSLLLLDIDHFKLFNDKHGHAVGDKVLRYVASVLKHQVRGSDIVARYGGEEFTVILPDTTTENALKVAEHIRGKVESQHLTDGTEKRNLGTVSVSVGVATYRQPEPPETLINRADYAMYFAKSNGRNQVSSEADIDDMLDDNMSMPGAS